MREVGSAPSAGRAVAVAGLSGMEGVPVVLVSVSGMDVVCVVVRVEESERLEEGVYCSKAVDVNDAVDVEVAVEVREASEVVVDSIDTTDGEAMLLVDVTEDTVVETDAESEALVVDAAELLELDAELDVGKAAAFSLIA